MPRLAKLLTNLLRDTLTDVRQSIDSRIQDDGMDRTWTVPVSAAAKTGGHEQHQTASDDGCAHPLPLRRCLPNAWAFSSEAAAQVGP